MEFCSRLLSKFKKKPKTNLETCDGFQCENGVCLDLEKRCDRVADCPNSEDEEFCNEGRFLAVELANLFYYLIFINYILPKKNCRIFIELDYFEQLLLIGSQKWV